MAVLLKTVSVRVSLIQIMQVRVQNKGKSVWKSRYVGDVSWTETFLAYLNRQELPEDQNEARCIVWRSKAYKVHEGELYKKSATGVLQRCISEEEGRQLLAEIHARLGGHHAAARALVSKAFCTGLYWPTARADAQDLVRHCIGRQLFANQSHMPPTALQTFPITCPFAV